MRSIAVASARTQTSPDLHTRHILLVTQALFFSSLIWCLAIYHGSIAERDGISYYGVFHPTIPILVLGYLIATIGLWRTAEYFKAAEIPRLTWAGLRVVGTLLLVLLVTPFNRGAVLNWTHMLAGVVGALFQLAISVKLLREHRSARAVAGFVVQLVGGIVAAFSLPDWTFNYLLVGEILYQVGFGWCLIEWTYALGSREALAWT